jgi:ABC-type polysaccharide/polyol phosphate export permease
MDSPSSQVDCRVLPTAQIPHVNFKMQYYVVIHHELNLAVVIVVMVVIVVAGSILGSYKNWHFIILPGHNVVVK